MKMMQSWKGIAVAAALALVSMTSNRAYAAFMDTARLNIDVAVTAGLSVALADYGTHDSTVTYAWSVSNRNFSNSDSSTTVLNDSGGLDEKWSLSTLATSLDQGSDNKPWELLPAAISSTVVMGAGRDHFALLAMFSSSATIVGGCPAQNDTQWDSANYSVTASPVQYDGTKYTRLTDAVNGPANPDKLDGTSSVMRPYNPVYDVGGTNPNVRFNFGKRALCWKILGPGGVSSPDTQRIPIIVTATSAP